MGRSMREIITLHFHRFYCYLFFLLMLGAVGCQKKTTANEKSSLDSLQRHHYTAMGDSISIAAQQALMKQLMTAIESGGPEYAVNFCNERAMPITDSLSNRYNCEIKRIALRNRNPNNALTTEEKIIYDGYAQSITTGAPAQPQLVINQKELLFYKPIVLGMPACLQCHGKPDQLDPKAYVAIQSKYPDDKAVNFSLGELRGMWKITFHNMP